MSKKKIVVLLLFTVFTVKGHTQESNILKFDNTFTLKLLTKLNSLVFEDGLNNHEFETNRPLDIGIGFGYKDFSFDFYMRTPFLYNQDYSKSQSFDVGSIYFYEDSCYFDGYIKYYNGFIDNTGKEINLKIYNIGVSGEYIFNKDHSIRSVYNLDRKQLESNGSFLIGGGIFIISINSDNDYINDYYDRKIIYYFGPNIGYSYTFIIVDNFFINLLFTFGINCIINKEEVSFGLQTFPKLSFGYHGKTWSMNIYANAYLLNDYIKEDEGNVITEETIGIVFSKRI